MLERINSPQDVKSLSYEDLESLAQEVRERIISVVSRTGGHLASSLGAVELAIALHKVFDSPRDKIVWDVGHQAYAHKLLTGRNERFDSLRQYGGISGFPSHFESEHDPFTVGHSSTAVSLALGLALGRDLSGEDWKVVAVIGDGSLSGGMCFEALNHAGHIQTDILVVLNSNNMAISPVQGALSQYVNRIISASTYNRIHDKIASAISKIPGIGKDLAKFGAKVEEALKGLIVPGWLFEELGFRYFGPIDGHNLRVLIPTLSRIKLLPGPKLLHVITQKGKGYRFAEDNPTAFHGVMQFDIDTGKVDKRAGRTFTAVFSEVALELFDRDENVVGITAAMLDGTGLKVVSERYPERVFDVGIAEEHAVTLSSGLARAGKVPIVAIYSTFLQRAYDQIVNDLALQDVGVILAVDRAGLVGEDGIMHHGLLDICYLRSIPNLTLLAPRDGGVMKVGFKWAYEKVKASPKVVALRYPRASVSPDPLEVPRNLTPGRGEVLRQGSEGVVVVAVGPLVYSVLEAIKGLGRDVTVIDPIFLTDLDMDWWVPLLDGKEVLVFEEGYKEGGFGEHLAGLFSGRARVSSFGVEKRFVLHGKREELLREVGLDVDGIKERIGK